MAFNPQEQPVKLVDLTGQHHEVFLARCTVHRGIDIQVCFRTGLAWRKRCAVTLGTTPGAVLPALARKGIPLMRPGITVSTQLNLGVSIIKVPGKPGVFGKLNDFG
jgi:hypothetical protein